MTLEQVYAWDPDLIFVTNFTTAQPQDLYDNTVGSYDWSSVNSRHRAKSSAIPFFISNPPFLLLYKCFTRLTICPRQSLPEKAGWGRE